MIAQEERLENEHEANNMPGKNTKKAFWGQFSRFSVFSTSFALLSASLGS